MKHKLAVTLWLALLAGCFHDERDRLSVNSLNGLWIGKYQAADGQLLSLALSIERGELTSLEIDQVPQGVNAAIEQVTANAFELSLTDGSMVSLLVDPDNTHAAYVDSLNAIAVVERGVSINSIYEEQDMTGEWHGFSVMIIQPFAVCDQFPASAIVGMTAAGLEMNIDDVNGESIASLVMTDSVNGRFGGQYANPVAGLDGSVEVLMADDKMFAMLRLCEQGQVTFGNCRYIAWNKRLR